MRSFLTALALAATTVLPAGATPQSPDYSNGGQCAGNQLSKCRYTLEIVNPSEIMILVPGLESLGYSRESTVIHCSEITGTDYTNLITDSDFESMHACLSEHT
jgi:hypothetical protein